MGKVFVQRVVGNALMSVCAAGVMMSAGAALAADVASTKPRAKEIEDVVIRERRTWGSDIDRFTVPRSVNVVGKRELAGSPEEVAIDNLRFEPGVFLEHRTSSTADPLIRGLGGGNLLYTVDGNTVTTLWGEGGFFADDMYGKVDPYTVERIEVIRGPGSVLYGSNALGGVINLVTRSAPSDYTEDGSIAYGGSSRTSYKSAANAYIARQEGWLAGGFFRVLAGGTYRDVNDLTGGRGQGTFENTSSEDYNWDIAADARPLEGVDLRFTWAKVNRNHTHRFYRPRQDNFNDREAGALKFTGTDLLPWWDRVEASVYFQNKEDRRRFLSQNVSLPNGVTLTTPRGKATTVTWQPKAEFVTSLGESHRLTYGLQSELSRGESPDDEEFTYTSGNQRFKASPDALWRYYAAYVQHEWNPMDMLTVVSGVRYDHFHYSTDPDPSVARPTTVSPDALTIKDKQAAVTGGTAVSVEFLEGHRAFAGFHRGFRQFSPKLSVSQVGAGVRVPSGLLDPLYSYAWEIGYKAQQQAWDAEAVFYRTRFDGFSTDDVPGTFNGQDWFDFDGDGIRDSNEDVLVFKTRGWAYIYGTELSGALRWHDVIDLEDRWTTRASFTWNIGTTSNRETASVPPAKRIGIRIPVRGVQPARLVLRQRWESAGDTGPWAELIGEFVGKLNRVPQKRITGDPGFRVDPAAFDTDSTIPLLRDDGRVPGFSMLHLRAGYKVNDHVSVHVAVDNFTDKDARRAHNRMSDPGIGFTFGLTATY